MLWWRPGASAACPLQKMEKLGACLCFSSFARTQTSPLQMFFWWGAAVLWHPRRSKLLGLVESKDVDFCEDRMVALSSVMQPLAEVGRFPLHGLKLLCQRSVLSKRSELPPQVTTASWPCTLAEANERLKLAKVNYLCCVDGEGDLRALTTRVDLIKNRDFPRATGGNTTLLVGAAVSLGEAKQAPCQAPGSGELEYQQRAAALVKVCQAD